jgi:hypothetical protein
MARARNIKPGYFSNEFLAELEPLARILFAGLWCWADREGRFEDRPKRIKADILPYDDCDINKLLNDLMNAHEQFIIRYEVDGKRYVQIVNFPKHQNPHIKEPASIIPAPPIKMKAPCENSASTVQEQEQNSSSPADSLNPITDSLNPITETNDISTFFETVWKLYPYKKGKGQISNTQKQKLFKIGVDELSRCIERYKKSKESWKEWQHGSTFFNSGYVDYLDQNWKDKEHGTATTGNYKPAYDKSKFLAKPGGEMPNDPDIF